MGAPQDDRCPDCGAGLVSKGGVAGLCPQCLLSLALLQSPAEGMEPEAPTLEGHFRGRLLGERYQIRELLGRGGMGEVYRAFDLKLRVDVALKAVRPGRADEARVREVLRGEVRAAREVVSPNVCRIFDLVDEDGQELVSMEYIDGQTLGTTLRERGPLELREAREIAAQFLSGLEAIHRAGLVHRDFKPENVMLTRAGRVVVMDFGLARVATPERVATVSGTPGYMSPEQARGEGVDARSDVFAAGIVLAEMVSVGGDRAFETRQALWRALRETPPRVPEGPWAAVLRQCLAGDPAKRPPSAQALARALEEVTQRLPGFEEKRPYPGLLSFTEEDAEFFFGREVEVEGVFKKLKRPRLLALIGPSGAGKTSFLRAGLLPSLPRTWSVALATPGPRPFSSLAQALLPHFAGEVEAMREFLHFEEPDTAVGLVSRWRKRHENVVVIVDQFEELFTQSPTAAQAAFALLLGRLVLEADAHVIVSLRDDFLIHCHGHEALAPAFSDLTPLGPLGESGLRRALVQPALSCGYRFEDDALVEEMITAVRGERGSLPLLAFAASRLFELRDREHGLLTREAYRQVGGVAGALAQHAEATLERIGAPRTPLVRELFRNLVTAQGTRAVRPREELLSVFGGKGVGGDKAVTTDAKDRTDMKAAPGRTPAIAQRHDSETPSSQEIEARAAAWGREDAEQVLSALVDARLLTTYEQTEEGGESYQQVEIVHESLLGAWPRLVRWQTQDADGAQLRDQLRQAAQLWQDRGQPEDLLWAGSAYRDLALWQERYPGGLSATEQAFAHAAARLSGRRRRRRRSAMVAVVTLAAAVALTTSMLWRRAEAQARQREAAELLALGRLHLEEFPTAALAHAIASLERADNAPARRFAVEALWKGPPARYFSAPGAAAWTAFSPDGRWLAGASRAGAWRLPYEGAMPQPVGPFRWVLGFADAGRLLVAATPRARDATPGGMTIHVLSFPEGRELRTFEVDASEPERISLAGADVFIAEKPLSGRSVVRRVSLRAGAPVEIGHIDGWEEGRNHGPVCRLRVDATGRWLAEVRGGVVRVRSLDAWEAPPRTLGRHEGAEHVFRAGSGFATSGPSGELRIWSTGDEGKALSQVFPGRAGSAAASLPGVNFDISGRWAATATAKAAHLSDLAGPPDAEPAALTERLGRVPGLVSEGAIASLSRDWLLLPRLDYAALWPLSFRHARTLRPPGEPALTAIAFSPDGRSLLSQTARREVRVWPLSPEAGATSRVAYADPNLSAFNIDSDPEGRFVVASRFWEGVAIVPLDGGAPRTLKGEGIHLTARFDREGRRVAFFADDERTKTAHVHLRNLESGEARDFDTTAIEDACVKGTRMAGYQWDVGFLPDGRPWSDGFGGLRAWDTAQGTSRALRPCDPRAYRSEQNVWHGFTLSRDGRLGVRVLSWQDSTASIVTVFDLAGGRDHAITSHGNRVHHRAALDPTGRILVTADKDSLVRVGPVTGEEPHLLFGHTAAVTSLAVSPDGKWIASVSMDGTIRLWPMPEGPPLHTRPYDELLAKLRALTNLRVEPDPASPTGFKLEVGPFPGWAKLPEW